MAANDQATQGAGVSAAMLLSLFAQNNQVSVPHGFSWEYYHSHGSLHQLTWRINTDNEHSTVKTSFILPQLFLSNEQIGLSSVVIVYLATELSTPCNITHGDYKGCFFVM